MMSPDDLLARVETLSQEVAALRVEVATLRAGRTMREGRRCPACGGDKILHAKQVSIPDSMGTKFPLSLASKISPWTGAKSFAPFAAYACTACGLVEWYVTSFTDVNSAEDLELVAPLEGGGPGRPYR